jgi:GNAT superfamily N-acetyltransferase
MQTLPAMQSDLEALVALRIKAMQPSLEAVGRFDPARARERFVNCFVAENTVKVIEGDQLLGFYVFVIKEDHIWIDHLYIDPKSQGAGIGSKIIGMIKQCASNKQLSLRLGALKQSRANQFYLQQGFKKIEEQEWDNIYQWSVMDS